MRCSLPASCFFSSFFLIGSDSGADVTQLTCDAAADGKRALQEHPFNHEDASSSLHLELEHSSDGWVVTAAPLNRWVNEHPCFCAEQAPRSLSGCRVNPPGRLGERTNSLWRAAGSSGG